MRNGLGVMAVCAALAAPAAGAAQQRVTLAEAEAAALSAGTRVRLAAADEALARADVLSARAFPNPTASAEYSKSAPQYHLTVEQPLELPGLRSARIRAAQAGAAAGRYRLELERAVARFEADRAYVQAAAAGELAGLSAGAARDARELVRIARIRRDAGDASDLDVELASVTEGSAETSLLADSLAAVTAILELQRVMGLDATRVTIALADSLAELAVAPTSAAPAVPLRNAVAEAELASREASLARERAARIQAPSLLGGVEWHDPEGAEPGYLPLLGVSIPVPLFDRNRGAIAAAEAGVMRARAELEAARRESGAALAAAEREREAARVRVEHGRALLAHARRVVALSAQGYREGAFPITTVVEAQQAAREALRQYVQDLASLRTAETGAVLAHLVGAAP